AGPDAIAGAREKSSESGPHVVSYVLQLLLDEHNCIRQTTIHHTQSGEEEVWEEWNEKQLLSFFARRPELSLPQVEHATSVKVSFKVTEQSAEPAASGAPVSDTPAVSTSAILPAVHRRNISPQLRKMEFVPAAAKQPSTALSHNQPYF